MIRNVRNTYPDAHIAVIVNSNVPREVIEHSGVNLDEIIVCNMHAGIKKSLGIIRVIKKENFS